MQRHALRPLVFNPCLEILRRFAWSLQLLLGSPFLLHHPVAYLARSFELGRVFKYEWTVNFKFLSEEAFVSQMLSVALLALTVIVLVLFAVKWLRSTGPIYVRDVSTREGERKQLLPEYVVKTLFVSNFIGIVFCRSLHYQVRSLASLLQSIYVPFFCCCYISSYPILCLDVYSQ